MINKFGAAVNIFSRQNSTEITNLPNNLHNYRYIGEQMEALGTRLDAARESLKNSKSAWSRWYWQETVDRLLMQWRALPILHDGQAQNTLIPRWSVDYNYWETSEEIATWDITDKMFYKMQRPNLDESWDRVRTERIMRCNCQ